MILLGLGLGIGVKTFNAERIKEWFTSGTREPELKLPTEGVKTDQWSLSIFKKMSELHPKGFVFSPIALNIALQDIQATVDDETAATISAMQLPSIEDALDVNAPVQGFSQLIIDETLALPDGVKALSLPLSSDRAKSFKDLHFQLSKSINFEFDYPIVNSMISRHANLVGFSLITQSANWLHPFQQNEGDYINFDVGQGNILILHALSVLAPIRLLHTADYEAYALVLKGDNPSEHTSCMLIIMPLFADLDDFIKDFDVVELNQIKATLLAQEEPHEIYFKIPAFKAQAQTISMRPLLERLGLGILFTEEAKFPHLSTQPIYLEDLWHSANINLQAVEKPLMGKKSATDFPTTMEINRPFIWMIGELGQGSTPSMMGSVPAL